MSFAKTTKRTMTFACAGLVFSAGAAFAQAGGGDVPTDAKKQGTQENGASSTGMSKGQAESGSMKKEGGEMEKKSGDKM